MNNFLAKLLFASAFLLANLSSYAATFIAASVLLVSEYTRITFESDQAIVRAMLVLKSPDRIVLDLKNVSINQSLKALASNVMPEDFYIKKVSVANFKQGVTRIVVDLKAAAMPKLRIYKPAGRYQHRLALNICLSQDTPSAYEENGETVTVCYFKTDTSNSDETKNSDAKIILEAKSVFELEGEMNAPIEA